MTLNELTRDNIGAVCAVYRASKLQELQFEFAARHDITRSVICNFERGINESMNALLAYIRDGLIENLETLDNDYIKNRIYYNENYDKIKHCK